MKIRIISAIIMCLIAIPILIIGGLPFKIFVAILGVASIYEILNVRRRHKKIPLAIRIISYILVGLLVLFGSSTYMVNYELIYKIIAVIFLIYFIPVIIINNDKKYDATDAFYVIGSTLFLAIAYTSCTMIVSKDILYLVYILLVTLLTDTFAYFTGYFIGKHKLCEKISPKKTWEGAVGGTVVGAGIAAAFYLVVINPSVNVFLIIGISILLSIVGQFGDLFFSSIKRHYVIKDYSNLIPGHGEVLDRLDSVIFVILTYVLSLSI